MEALTYTQVRKNFSETMNKVCQDHKPLIITRQNREPVVMISLEDYNSIEETLYLLRSPKNAGKLLESISEVEKNSLNEKNLIEE